MNESVPSGWRKVHKQSRRMVSRGRDIARLTSRATTKAGFKRPGIRKLRDRVQVLIRMVIAYYNGSYREISLATYIYAVAALLYFVNPFDVIPDFILGAGFIDDASILAFVIKQIGDELKKFEQWEISSFAEEVHS